MTKHQPGVPTSWTSLPPSGDTVDAEIHLNGVRSRPGDDIRLIFSITPAQHERLTAVAELSEDASIDIVTAHATKCVLALRFDEATQRVVVVTATIGTHELTLMPSTPQ